MVVISASPIYSPNQRLAIRNHSKVDQTGLHTARDLLSHRNTDVSQQCDTLCIALDVDCLTCLHIIQNCLQELLIYPVMEIMFFFPPTTKATTKATTKYSVCSCIVMESPSIWSTGGTWLSSRMIAGYVCMHSSTCYSLIWATSVALVYWRLFMI